MSINTLFLSSQFFAKWFLSTYQMESKTIKSQSSTEFCLGFQSKSTGWARDDIAAGTEVVQTQTHVRKSSQTSKNESLNKNG